MKMDANFLCMGLLALAMGCGDIPQEDSSPPVPGLQVSPPQGMPSEVELAAVRTLVPGAVVPVQYLVDPATGTQLSVSAGVEDAVSTSSSGDLAPRAVRRFLK
ncbi:hypothetical protein BHS05_09020 [Myxococcus xanthus]|nr:hypothetical protein BHS05_09020 [Myxococcus xanthus]